MAYYYAVSECFGCGGLFSYNPHLVPSHRDAVGEKQPVCRHCVELVNPTRIKNGLEPIQVLPGAYIAASEDGDAHVEIGEGAWCEGVDG